MPLPAFGRGEGSAITEVRTATTAPTAVTEDARDASGRWRRLPRFWFLALLVVQYPVAVFMANSRSTGGDEAGYLRYASNLLHHGTFSLSTAAPFRPSVLRTPGYPLFVAALKAVGLGGQNGIIAVQLALVGVAAVATYLFVSRITGDDLAANVSAVATVIYLPLLEFSAFYLTEVLSFALAAVVMALLFVHRDDESQRRALVRFAGAGLLFGYLSLVRPEYYAVGVPLIVI